MLAADATFDALTEGAKGYDELTGYADAFRNSWVYDELWTARNFRPAFKWGLLGGTLYNGLDQ